MRVYQGTSQKRAGANFANPISSFVPFPVWSPGISDENLQFVAKVVVPPQFSAPAGQSLPVKRGVYQESGEWALHG